MLLLIISCDNRNADKPNLELTSFSSDLLMSFSKFSDPDLNHDSTFSYIMQCYNGNICLFGYSGFIHKDFVGKAVIDGLMVKIYGDANPLIYKKRKETKEKEKNNIDGNYVEDLIRWDIYIANDTISFSCRHDKSEVYAIREVCRKHFPDKNIFWKRSSFRIDDIRM